jgi:hypothetical protein
MRTATVSVTGVAASSWLPLDSLSDGYGDGLYLKCGAGATVSVEVTPDNIFDPTVTPIAFACNIAALTGAVANASGPLTQAVRAVRLNQTVGASTSTLVVVVRGMT